LQDQALNTEGMLALARSRAPEDRERLLAALAELCRRPAGLSVEARRLVETLFLDLVARAERDIRQRLAEALASDACAPHALVVALALDEIEVARPVIARSPVLAESDLLRLLVEATLEHQIETARRPRLGPAVVQAVIDRGEPAVLAALAGNETAEVREDQLRRLVEASRRLTALRGPLARHPRLTAELAHGLYAWVGEALRARIAERFAIDTARLDLGVEAAVRAAADLPPDGETGTQAEMERRLVDKLHAAGQLRPGYLLRALRDGRKGLFQTALEALGGYPEGSVARALAARRADLLALACVGVGIDRSVFPTILALLGARAEPRPPTDVFAAAPADAARAFLAGVAAI